jgi:hypothetical protein
MYSNSNAVMYYLLAREVLHQFMPPIPARGIGGLFLIVAALLSPGRARCATADCPVISNDLHRTVDIYTERWIYNRTFSCRGVIAAFA